MHYSGKEGTSTEDVQPGGQSCWEQEAGPRQPQAESIGATTPRPSSPSLPNQLRTYPSRHGDLTQLTPSQHRTWPRNHLARTT